MFLFTIIALVKITTSRYSYNMKIYETTKLEKRTKRRLKAFASLAGYDSMSAAIEAMLDTARAPQITQQAGKKGSS